MTDLLDPSLFDSLTLSGRHLCDVQLVAKGDGPGRIDSAWGTRIIEYIEDGEFAGPALSGRVLPGGGDWPTLANDGEFAMRLDVRAVWQTHDGAKLFVQYYGFMALGPPSEASGNPMEADPSSYYFRVAPTFQTSDERYAWLNKTLCVGVGRFTPGGLGYRIYAIQ
jgi:hypothetical protein